MHLAELTYLGTVGLAGAVARSMARGLPDAVRLRLEARPAEGLMPGWIWLHAVSVGELLLAQGLIGLLRDEGHAIHVTTGTRAGMSLLATRLPGWDGGTGRVTGGAFPLDDPEGLAPFLAARPGAFIALETELWPNLLRALAEAAVPAAVVNGRLTARTLARGGPWMRQAARRLSLVAARDAASLEAFHVLGAPWVALGGNLKADLPPPLPLHGGWNPLRAAWADFPVVVAGNTVEGEEDLVIAAWREARDVFPELRLMLAPRQPRRFGEVAARMKALGLAFRRASEPWPGDPACWVPCEALLMDTLGELAAAYAEGTVALVGGGWTWSGGHNPLEPARFGLPTLIGPGYDNFQDLVAPLREDRRVVVVNPEDLGSSLRKALEGAPLRSKGMAPLPDALQGTLARTRALLKIVLPRPRYEMHVFPETTG